MPAAPAGTPRPVIERLCQALTRATSSPDVKSRLAAQGVEVVNRLPKEFAEVIRQQLAQWASVVKAAGIHLANIFLVVKDPASGELRGVAIDMARELGRRIGVPVELVTYANASRLTRAAASGEWDVLFQAAEASRAAEIVFTAGFAEIDATYLVPPGSPLRSVAGIDREGVRVTVAGRVPWT